MASEARKALRAARAALAANEREDKSWGIHWETDEFLRLNHAVCEAERLYSWRDDVREILDRFRYRKVS